MAEGAREGKKMADDTGKLAGEMITFMKVAFNNCIESMMTLQAQNLRLLTYLEDQSLLAQKEGRTKICEVTNSSKKALEDYKKITEENLDRLSDHIK